jgi:hypothetical protein
MSIVLHNVFFTLKDRSANARQALVEGCRKHLSGHPGEVFFACGTRIEDHVRDVNDREYDVSLHIGFKDTASHDAYQKAPRHKDFIDLFQAGWAKVRVFDSSAEAPSLR